MKIAELSFVGVQAGYKALPAIKLYNVTHLSEPHDQLVLGSTVTIATVERLGYTVQLASDAPMRDSHAQV